MSFHVERDNDDYLAYYPGLPLYGIGENEKEAVQMLKREIESLRADLAKDDFFTNDWIAIKRLLENV